MNQEYGSFGLTGGYNMKIGTIKLVIGFRQYVVASYLDVHKPLFSFKPEVLTSIACICALYMIGIVFKHFKGKLKESIMCCLFTMQLWAVGHYQGNATEPVQTISESVSTVINHHSLASRTTAKVYLGCSLDSRTAPVAP